MMNKREEEWRSDNGRKSNKCIEGSKAVRSSTIVALLNFSKSSRHSTNTSSTKKICQILYQRNLAIVARLSSTATRSRTFKFLSINWKTWLVIRVLIFINSKVFFYTKEKKKTEATIMGLFLILTSLYFFFSIIKIINPFRKNG